MGRGSDSGRGADGHRVRLDQLIAKLKVEKWTSAQVRVDAAFIPLDLIDTNLQFKTSQLTAALASVKPDLTAIEKLVAAANS